MATPVEEQREIEVLEWDDASNSFTTAGDTNPDLDRLRRDRILHSYIGIGTNKP
jgi:hypothetical protein